ncbi:hypothetical protein cypCar_00010921, partial [Cyprinus carpio]
LDKSSPEVIRSRQSVSRPTLKSLVLSLQSGAVGVNQSLNWNNMARRTDTREWHSQERLAGATSSLGRSHGKKTEMSIKKRHGDAGEYTFSFIFQTVLAIRHVWM